MMGLRQRAEPRTHGLAPCPPCCVVRVGSLSAVCLQEDLVVDGNEKDFTGKTLTDVKQ